MFRFDSQKLKSFGLGWHDNEKTSVWGGPPSLCVDGPPNLRLSGYVIGLSQQTSVAHETPWHTCKLR